MTSYVASKSCLTDDAQKSLKKLAETQRSYIERGGIKHVRNVCDRCMTWSSWQTSCGRRGSTSWPRRKSSCHSSAAPGARAGGRRNPGVGGRPRKGLMDFCLLGAPGAQVNRRQTINNDTIDFNFEVVPLGSLEARTPEGMPMAWGALFSWGKLAGVREKRVQTHYPIDSDELFGSFNLIPTRVRAPNMYL